MCVCSFVCRVAPHTVPSGLSPVVGTRCSVSSQHALGDCCCLHMYTGASASENHTPGLHSHARTYTHTQTQKKRDLTDFCFKYLQLHTFVAIEEGFSSFSKISNYFLLPVLSKAIRNNTFICYFNLVFTLDGYSCPQKDRETDFNSL